MTTELALEYIPRRMSEMGHDNNYILRFRHLILKPSEKIEIDASNQLFILVEEPQDISIDSLSGIFDLSIQNTNEMQYEHQGIISIRNLAEVARHVRFIQVIPRHKKSTSSTSNT
ncbi:MAG: hypothetical protein WC223_05085 [Bacteroidales bacterium]|jgi:hypothetical protein